MVLISLLKSKRTKKQENANVSVQQSIDTQMTLSGRLPTYTTHRDTMSLEEHFSSPNFLEKPLLVLVEKPEQSRLAIDFAKAHHSYVPVTNVFGRRLTYLIYLHGRLVGAIGASDSPAFFMKVRDAYIGWPRIDIGKHLKYLVSNYRFTLLDDVPPNTASRVLSVFVRLLPKDWEKKYGVPIYAIDTVVNMSRGYEGKCYKAAGWTLVGDWTSGKKAFHATWKSEGKGTGTRENLFSEQRMRYFIKGLTTDYLEKLKK